MIAFLIPKAMAAGTGGAGGPIPGLDIFIIVAFALVFYFIVWRSLKRMKTFQGTDKLTILRLRSGSTLPISASNCARNGASGP